MRICYAQKGGSAFLLIVDKVVYTFKINKKLLKGYEIQDLSYQKIMSLKWIDITIV